MKLTVKKMSSAASYYSVTEVTDSLSKKIIVKIETSDVDEFQLKMLQGECIGILKPVVSNDERHTFLTYEVSNCISMKYYFDTPREPESMIDVLLDIVDVVSDSKNYYLSHSSFLYDKRYMYYDSMTSSVKMIYIPIKFPITEDVLSFLKSEMLKDLHSSYNEGKYTAIMFCLLKATTLSNLKHMLLDIESRIFDNNRANQKKDEEVEIIDDTFLKEPSLKQKKNHKEEGNSKNKDANRVLYSKIERSKRVLPLEKKLVSVLAGALVSALICFLGLKVSAPIAIIVPISLLSGFCAGYFINKVVSFNKEEIDKTILLKKTTSENGELVDKKVYLKEEKQESMLKTVLLKKKNENKRLINMTTGETYSIDLKSGMTCLLGRGDNSHIKISDSSIGRNHLQLLDLNGDLYIMDNNTLNGSFVNKNQLIPLKKYILTHGDEVCIGTTTLRYEIV